MNSMLPAGIDPSISAAEPGQRERRRAGEASQIGNRQAWQREIERLQQETWFKPWRSREEGGHLAQSVPMASVVPNPVGLFSEPPGASENATRSLTFHVGNSQPATEWDVAASQRAGEGWQAMHAQRRAAAPQRTEAIGAGAANGDGAPDACGGSASERRRSPVEAPTACAETSLGRVAALEPPAVLQTLAEVSAERPSSVVSPSSSWSARLADFDQTVAITVDKPSDPHASDSSLRAITGGQRVAVGGLASPAAQRPVRLHLQWSATGAAVWIGHDQGHGDTVVQLLSAVERWLALQGLPLAEVVVNGLPQRRTSARSNIDQMDHLPATPARSVETGSPSFVSAALQHMFNQPERH